MLPNLKKLFPLKPIFLWRNNFMIMNRARSLSNSTSDDGVILEQKGAVGVITLNRPKALNALNLAMIRKLYPTIKDWEKDSSISVMVMKGIGEKAFCAGGDVRAIAEAGKIGDPLTKLFFKEEYMINYAIGTLKTPIVALIDGITMGGGVGLSVHCHYRVATEKTVFAMPETAIGFFPDVGGGYFLPRLAGKLGTFLALTGHRLKGMDVYKAGIATHFVPSNKIYELEKDLQGLPNPNHDSIQDVLSSHHSDDANKNIFSLEKHMDQINSVYSHISLEEIMAALNKDGSEWASKQIATLRRMSPISLKVSLKQFIEGEKCNLADDLIMEYRISQRFMADHDFYEGIRAVLIDRDNKPSWNPSAIEDVSNEKVNSYFETLPPEDELNLSIDVKLTGKY